MLRVRMTGKIPSATSISTRPFDQMIDAVRGARNPGAANPTASSTATVTRKSVAIRSRAIRSSMRQSPGLKGQFSNFIGRGTARQRACKIAASHHGNPVRQPDNFVKI